jgi:DNA-binding MarR family transcriptional regulator
VTDVGQAAQRISDAARQITHFMYAGHSFSWLPTDLTLPQLKVLVLSAAAGGTTGAQMARDLGVSLPTVSGLVDRLEDRGLVRRGDDPSDRRVTRVVATGDGQMLVQRLYQFRVERLTELLAALSPDDLRAVEHTFDVLAAAARSGGALVADAA